MKYIELFSGIGGMGRGLMQAGMECAGYCELDKFAHKAFQLLHDPEERMWNAYDVRGVSDDDIRLLGEQRGPIDLIAGGFPCQAFSIAGKRQGFADQTRGTLFFEIIRFATILKPKYLLLENVKGLLNHDGGRTYATILCALDELGYDCEWQLLNSKSYVPQNRERVFIVGHLRGSGGRKVFPFDSYDKKDTGLQRQPLYANTLTTRYGQSMGSGTYIVESEQHEKVHCINPRKEDGSQTYQQVRVYDTDGIMTALSAQLSGRFNIKVGPRIRKLTPLECFRIQSFPDEWHHKLRQAGMQDSHLYKMAGNAVTSRVAYEIAWRIMEGER